GPSEKGFVLPNGWRLTPAGEQVPLTDLPLNILTTPDGKYALVATSGYNAHELTVIDLATRKKAAMQSTKNTWFGLAADAKSGRFWWSGGGGDSLHTFTWADGKPVPGADYPPPEKKPEEPKPAETKPGETKPAEPKKDPPS